jgi:hypothetical protein
MQDIAVSKESWETDFARRKVDKTPTSGSSEVTESCDNSESEYDFFISLDLKGSVSECFRCKLSRLNDFTGNLSNFDRYFGHFPQHKAITQKKSCDTFRKTLFGPIPLQPHNAH